MPEFMPPSYTECYNRPELAGAVIAKELAAFGTVSVGSFVALQLKAEDTKYDYYRQSMWFLLTWLQT